LTLALVVLVAGGLLVVTGRTVVALVAYVVLAATASVLIAPAAADSLLAVFVFGVMTLMKVVVAPLGILWFLRAQPAARNLRPSLSAPLRLLLAIGFAALGARFAQDVRFQTDAATWQLGLGVFAIACSIGMLIVHRNLIAHLIGLLAVGTGITLCGAILAPSLPESVELGATFDVLVGTFVGLTLIRAFAAHDPLLDVESLRRLRG
jgi:hydrogenase-4 component E